MKYIKFVRIFLLVLIIIGIGLLATQKMWVPKVVDKIISKDTPYYVFHSQSGENAGNIETNTYAWSMENGAKDLTPDYNAPKTSVLDNKIYKEKCVANDKYFVIENDLDDSVGSNHLIKYKTNKNQNFDCKYVVEEGDFEIKNEEAEYTLALENDFLILDSGTGPGRRGLIVYNLKTRKKVFEDTYSGEVSVINNTIVYWTASTKTVTPENCPESIEWQKQGLGAAFDTTASLNLLTLVKTESTEYRCSPQQ